MEYRTLPHGGEKISVIVMGSSVVGEQKEADIIRTVEYALDKPGVLTVVGGPGNVEQLKEILSYLNTSEEERDYSVIASFTPDDSVGKCVY